MFPPNRTIVECRNTPDIFGLFSLSEIQILNFLVKSHWLLLLETFFYKHIPDKVYALSCLF